jgi:chromate transporter
VDGAAAEGGMTGGVLWQIAVGFAAVSLISVGGGIAVIPEMSRLVVDVHGWMDQARFTQLFALAQAAPGPNILVVGLIGWHVAGLAGMLVATAAMTVPAGVLAYGFSRLRRRLAGNTVLTLVEKGLVPIALGLIMAAGVILAQKATGGWLTAALVAGSTLFVWRTERSPLWIIGLGAATGAFFL